ncbi:hypothetical protein C0585_05825 [Candidatus Woesearchaeota archaeon]|nr:MAG: hypothetical protein C0585_05825 [Candidatus Woesearchaeota archaeon]
MPKVELRVNELADFLFSNSDRILYNINSKTKEHLELNKRFIDHIKYLRDTISPYNIDKNKIDELDFKMIQLKINEINNNVDELITLVEEDPNHLTILEKIEIFENRFDEVHDRLKEPLKKIEIYFKDMVPVLMDKLHGMKKNLLQLKDVLDDEKLKEYYILHNSLLKLKDIHEATHTKSKTNKKLSSDVIKHKVRLNELKAKKDTLTYTESFKMSEKTYKDYRDLMNKIGIEKEIVDKEFKDIIPLLKAYNSKYFDRIIDNYIVSPSETLLDDKDFRIDLVIKKIKKMITDDKIKITKNKNKIESSLKNLKKTDLTSMQKKLRKYEDDLKRKKMLLSKNKIILDIIELDYQIDHVLDKISNIESELTQGVEDFGIDFNELLEASVKNVSRFTNRRIKISQND